uniref:C2H2-type domain-containing protein n=1 Tax=viral metagenome TaxID=1070528 RepID=A0A6C0H1P4_9ZZZZ
MGNFGEKNMFRYFIMFQKNPAAEIQNVYKCDACNFITGNKKDYIRHERTKKHGRNVSPLVSFYPSPITPPPEPAPEPAPCDDKCKFVCKDCNKNCISRVTLWRHRKKCQPTAPVTEEPPVENTHIMKEMIIEVIRQNNQQNAAFIENFTENFTEKFMEKFSEMSKQQTVVTNNMTMNNNNTVNNQFNLNFFLNEKCKDAVNLVDFINSLQVQVSDLVNTGKVGFVEGITTILLDKLRDLDVYTRPMHCTDIKREIIYVKNQNVWEKENDEKTHMKSLVNIIARKNLEQISKWAEQNPDFMTLDSSAYNEYIQIGMNSTGGTVEQQEKNIDKVVTNILKAVVIDKQTERMIASNSAS